MTIVEALRSLAPDGSDTKCEANCAESIKLAITKCGYNPNFFSVSCTTTRKLLRSSNCTEFVEIFDKNDWQENDLVLFNWYYKSGSTDAEHIAVVSKVDNQNKVIYYDDFNGGGDGNHRTYCAGRKRSMDDPYIDSHFRPVDTHSSVTPTVEYKSKSLQLHKGDKGILVKILQKFLNRSDIKCEVDGYFGDETRNAVMEFQRRAGLDSTNGVDGWVGEETLTAIERMI